MSPATSRPARSAQTVLTGVAALGGILASLVVIPVLLFHFAGSPIPSGIPSMLDIQHALSTPDDGTLFVGALRLVGWVAWLIWAISLLLAIPAQLVGRPAPHLPGLAWPQARAAALTGAVAALLALLVAGPATAATATPAPVNTPGGAVAAAPQQQAGPRAAAPGSQAAPADIAATRVTVHRGDNLWGIAQHTLGQGERYPELVQASQSTVQPDGRHLSSPSQIYPGWQITVPAHQQAATSAGSSTSTGAAPAAPTPVPAPVVAPTPAVAPTPTAGQAIPTPAPAPTSEQASAAPAPVSAPAAPAPAAAAPAPASASTPAAAVSPTPTQSAAATPPAPEHTHAQAEASDQSDHVPALLGLSALSAAGLIGLLTLARRRQTQHRRPGQRIAQPEPAVAEVETQLRATADPLSADDLDIALRGLASHARRRNAPMPALRAVRLTQDDTLELYLVDTSTQLPAPFTSLEDGAWLLHRTDLPALRAVIDPDVPAPYPSLVTIGHDEHNALLLLHLEELGSLSLLGDPTAGREVLTAITCELIASSWADDIRITLVDVMPELVEALRSDRVSYTQDLPTALTGLEYATGVHQQSLTDAHLPDAVTARAAGLADDTWTPHLLVIAGDITPQQHHRLTELAATRPRVAIALLTDQCAPAGDWTMTITVDGPDTRGDLAPVPIHVTPQRLPADLYEQFVQLYVTTHQPDQPGPTWTTDITHGATALADLPIPEPDNAPSTPTAEVVPTETPALTSPRSATADAVLDMTTAAPWRDDTAGNAGEQATPAEETATAPAGPALPVDDQPVGEPAADHTDTAPHETRADKSLADQELVDQDAATTPATADLDQPSSADATNVTAIREHPAHKPALRLLGPVEVLHAPGRRPNKLGRATEVIAYLALHPGQSREAFDAALFPGQRVLAGKRNQYTSDARAWMGTAPDGHPYVGIYKDIGYALADDTDVDVWTFRKLVEPSVGKVSTDALRRALELVKGQPLSGVNDVAYAWAAPDKDELLASVADVAHELASRYIAAGNASGAKWAANKGLEAEPISEVLWRDAITAAYQSGQPGAAKETINRCLAALEAIDSEPDEDTLALINETNKRAHA